MTTITAEFLTQELTATSTYLHIKTNELEALKETLTEIVYDFDQFDLVQNTTDSISVFIPFGGAKGVSEAEEFLMAVAEVIEENTESKIIFSEGTFEVKTPVVTILFRNSEIAHRVYLINAQQEKAEADTSINYVAYTALDEKGFNIDFDHDGLAYVETTAENFKTMFENDYNVSFVENNLVFA